MYTNKPSGVGAVQLRRREAGSQGEVLAVVAVEVDDVRWLIGGSPNYTPSLAVLASRRCPTFTRAVSGPA